VVVLERPVGPDGSALPLTQQAELLAQALPESGAVGARFVGVSGGATVGLYLAIHHPEVVGGLVLHEPLVGHLAPELHHQFQIAAATASRGEAEAMDVVRAVMGDATWALLAPEARASSEALAPRWRREITEFAAFDPSVADLVALERHSMVVTVGERSGPERRAAAEVLRRWSGADVVEIPGAGNAVQLDAPEAFAQLISTGQTVSTGGAS
jgi:pimeloyl-ACP methyl ester carboxylesterase